MFPSPTGPIRGCFRLFRWPAGAWEVVLEAQRENESWENGPQGTPGTHVHGFQKGPIWPEEVAGPPI